MATLPKVLINQADSKSAGGVALRVRTQVEPSFKTESTRTRSLLEHIDRPSSLPMMSTAQHGTDAGRAVGAVGSAAAMLRLWTEITRTREGGSLLSFPSRLHRGFQTVTPSGPTSPWSSCPKSSAKRLRARLTRLLIVPIFVPQISAASS
jgi:hypothetical protein